MTEFFAFLILFVAVVLFFAPIPVFVERYWWPVVPVVYAQPQQGSGCGMVVVALVAMLVLVVGLFVALEVGVL